MLLINSPNQHLTVTYASEHWGRIDVLRQMKGNYG